MDLKNEFIKSTISHLNRKNTGYLINIPDYSNNEKIIKLLFKILSKEVLNPLNICLLSGDISTFNTVFPNFKNSIKLNSPYNISHHKLSFNILDRSFLKTNDIIYDMIIVLPYEDVKPKHVVKALQKATNLKNLVLIGKKVDKTKLPHELKMLSIDEFSFILSQSSTYYNFINSKLADIK